MKLAWSPPLLLQLLAAVLLVTGCSGHRLAAVAKPPELPLAAQRQVDCDQVILQMNSGTLSGARVVFGVLSVPPAYQVTVQRDRRRQGGHASRVIAPISRSRLSSSSAGISVVPPVEPTDGTLPPEVATTLESPVPRVRAWAAPATPVLTLTRCDPANRRNPRAIDAAIEQLARCLVDQLRRT